MYADSPPAVLAQTTTLKLDNVTLILGSGTNVLPTTALSVSNVHLALPCDHGTAPATLFLPALSSLDFDYSLPPHLCPNLPPLSLDQLASPTLEALTIHLLSNPATDGPTAPILSVLTPASSGSPLSLTTPPLPPTLAMFPSLSSLTLLADSSYRTPLYFPLLQTISQPSPLTHFAVLVELGYRDKQLEVKEMAIELAAAVVEGHGFGDRLKRLELAEVFGRFEAVEGMRQLREVAKSRGIEIEYAER